jgi:formate dehydrogenase
LPARQAAAQVRALLADAPRRRDLLIEHLHALQDRFGHLTPEHLAALADEMQLATDEVVAIASSWPHFEQLATGVAGPSALAVRVCRGLSCELAGGLRLRQDLARRLGPDARVTSAPCMGRCEQAPAVLVGRHPVPCATAARVADAVAEGAVDHEPEGYVGFSQYRAAGGYRLLAACMQGERAVGAVVDALDSCGPGSDGSRAARRWRSVREAPAPRLVAVDAGGGEAGDFRDRLYLERDPHRLLEGMLVAAWAVGAQAAYLHLRADWHGCRKLLEQELARLRADPPAAGLPHIELRRSAGRPGAGAADAMIAALQGGARGSGGSDLFGRPTLAHDVETLYWLRQLLEDGTDWFRHKGVNGRQGLRSHAVSGRVQLPGLKLAPVASTAQELVDEHCGGMADGHALYAVVRPGAAAPLLPADLVDTPLAEGRLPHAPALVVLSGHDRAAVAARHLLQQRADGQELCPACRAGAAEAVLLLQGTRPPRARLAALAEQIGADCRCGEGPALAEPLASLLRHFPHELR